MPQPVTGNAADQTGHNAKQAIYEASGTFGDGALTLRIQPLRIDWLYTPSASDGLPTPDDTLGLLDMAVAQFEPIAERWFALADSPELVRLAFGTVLLDAVESRQAGYRQLGDLLPDVRLDDNSSDFLYQINRPRQSAVVPGLLLNRLSKWSVNAIQALVVNEGGISLADKRYACRVEMDICAATIRSAGRVASSQNVTRLPH